MNIDELCDEVRKMVTMYEGGMSGQQVGDALGYSQKVVNEIVAKLGLTRYRGWYHMGEKNRNWRKANLEPSPALAYVLGVIYGDGSVTYRNSIVLSVCDLVFAESFSDGLEKIGLKPNKIYIHNRPKRPNARVTYRACVMNAGFAQWFHQLTLEAVEEQYLTTYDMAREFVRGFYESEGHYAVLVSKVFISNTDRTLLELCKRLIERLGYTGIGIYQSYAAKGNRKACYHLYIGRKEQVARFLEEIKPVIKKGESRTKGRQQRGVPDELAIPLASYSPLQ